MVDHGVIGLGDVYFLAGREFDHLHGTGPFTCHAAQPIVNASQSNKGIHVRVIFAEPVESWIIRRFATAFLEEAALDNCDSFDRFFPAQDKLATNDNALGNQIALPLNFERANTTGGTVLLDREFRAIPLEEATWDYLDLHEPTTRDDIMSALEDIDQLMALEECPGYVDGTYSGGS